MEAQAVTAAQARNFAGQAGLVATRVPALPTPVPAQPASSWENP